MSVAPNIAHAPRPIRAACAVAICLVLGLLGPAAAGAYVYWGNAATGTIGRATLAGAEVNVAYADASGPQAVAVHGQYLYWADLTTSSIGRVGVDGSDPLPEFIAGANNPSAVAVDASHVYWINSGNAKIGRANLNGTGVNQASSVPNRERAPSPSTPTTSSGRATPSPTRTSAAPTSTGPR